MNDWISLIPRVRDALNKHYSEAPSDELQDWAEKIFDEFQVAKEFERWERAAKSPAKDREELLKLAKSLKRFSKRTEALGQLAGLHLREFAEQEMRARNPHFGRMGIVQAPQYLSALFETFATEYEHAALQIDESATLPLAFSDDDEASKTKPRAEAPLRVAMKAKTAFEDLGGRTPGRANYLVGDGHRTLTKPGGPYFKLVTDIFNALGIDSNVEYYIREALSRDSGDSDSMEESSEST